MGLFDRLSTLLRSNANAAIDKISDPGREVEQRLIDLRAQYKAAQGQTQAAMVAERRGRQAIEQLTKSSDEWQARAERAVRAGDDALAGEALVRTAEVDGMRTHAEEELAAQRAQVEQMTALLRQAEGALKALETRKETLKAEARNSKAGAVGGDASKRYDQLVTGVDVAEAEVELDNELAKATHQDHASLAVEKKLDDLAKTSDMDARLAALKAKMEPPKPG